MVITFNPTDYGYRILADGVIMGMLQKNPFVHVWVATLPRTIPPATFTATREDDCRQLVRQFLRGQDDV